MYDENNVKAMYEKGFATAAAAENFGGLFGAGEQTSPRPRKRRAALVISVEKLAKLLNLRDGIEIVSGNYDARREVFEIFLNAEAGDLPIGFPLKSRGAPICNVALRDLADLD